MELLSTIPENFGLGSELVEAFVAEGEEGSKMTPPMPKPGSLVGVTSVGVRVCFVAADTAESLSNWGEKAI